MAMANPKLPTDAPTDRLPTDLPAFPDDWEPAADDGLDAGLGERAAWEHAAGLRVSVRDDHRPTQMHTPETSTDDTGFTAHVTGEFGGRLTARLASKAWAYEAAVRFMAAYPNGEFDVPRPADVDGKVRWVR